MNDEEIIVADDHASREKSNCDTERAGKFHNLVNNAEGFAKIKSSVKLIDETDYGIPNGTLSHSNSSNVVELASDLQRVNIDSSSTSGLTKIPGQESQRSNHAVEDTENSTGDISSCQITTPPACPDTSISRHRPSTLPLGKTKRRVLKVSPEEISSPDSPTTGDGADFISPETDSQDELENSIMVILNNSEKAEMIPELTLDEEQAELRNWKACTIAGVKRQIDLKVIEPYKRVLSHGGYLNTGSHNAIITFSACFLPHKSRKDYHYVMDNLFFYILHTLNQLVTDDYILVYLHGGTTKDCIPTFSWLKRCYQMIDWKLKKNLKTLYLVHPTFLLKTLVTMIKPFISSKFSRKIHFVACLSELSDILPIEEASIPDKVKQYDRIKMSLLNK